MDVDVWPYRIDPAKMSRPLRLEFPGAVYHIMSRGDRRKDIFFDEGDRRAFLGILANEVLQQRWRLYAYCLMGNHYHLLLETPDANLVVGMRRLNGMYAQTFNRRHGLVGHLLQGRYQSIVVDQDVYLRELARYVVLNPVRARLVDQAQSWVWSSYRATAGIISVPHWLTVEPVLAQWGDDIGLAQQIYRDFVADGLRAASPWAELRGQIYLGKEPFLARMEKMAVAHIQVDVPRCQHYPARPTAEELLGLVASAFGTSPEEVRARDHQPAFQAWVYLMRRATNLGLREAAHYAGVSPGRVSQIQRAFDTGGAVPEIEGLLKTYKV